MAGFAHEREGGKKSSGAFPPFPLLLSASPDASAPFRGWIGVDPCEARVQRPIDEIVVVIGKALGRLPRRLG